MSSKNYFLSTKEAKKATKQFKELLQKQGLSLRIENGGNCDSASSECYYELTYVIKEMYERFGKNFCISTNSKNILYFRTWSSFSKEFLNDTILYLLEIAKAIGTSALIFDMQGKSQQMLHDINGVRRLPVRNALDIKYINSYMEDDEFVYINIKDEYIENQLAIFYATKNYLEVKKEQNPTLEVNFSKFNNKVRTYAYYVNGLKSTFTICLNDETILKDEYFNETVQINEPGDINKALGELFDRVENETKFPSLIDPPKHHFQNYLFQKFYRSESLITDTFNLLMEHVEPKEIESSFATSPEEAYKTLNEKEDILLADIHSIFFIINFNKGEVEKFTDLKKASLQYEQKVTAAFYNVYVSDVNNLKQELKNLTTEQ